MANKEHLKILKQGVEVWNQWREENPDIRPDLSGADLSGADLSGVNLSETILSFAHFSGANLSRADFMEANLLAVDLTGANLCEAHFHGATLSGADFHGANLRRVNFSGAHLRGANFCDAVLCGADLAGADLRQADLNSTNLSEAQFGWTVFGDNDLSVTEGLDSVIHEGPSYIDVHTIYRSKGCIPEIFLRGAGVPDTFITYIRSLVGQPIQFYSCFISHSSEDKCFCDRLYADLRANGVRTWYFPEDARWGETVWGEIDRGIKIYDKLVVVCSESLLQSGPVLREIERALNREDREGKNILFPIRIDNYIFDHWEHPRKADVVSKVVGDFRGWDQSPDKYDAAFKKLLMALEAEDSD